MRLEELLLQAEPDLLALFLEPPRSGRGTLRLEVLLAELVRRFDRRLVPLVPKLASLRGAELEPHLERLVEPDASEGDPSAARRIRCALLEARAISQVGISNDYCTIGIESLLAAISRQGGERIEEFFEMLGVSPSSLLWDLGVEIRDEKLVGRAPQERSSPPETRSFCTPVAPASEPNSSGEPWAEEEDYCAFLTWILRGRPQRSRPRFFDDLAARAEFVGRLQRRLRGALDRRIIGQERAKATIVTAVISHAMRLIGAETRREVTLLLGPSGTGKSEIMRTIAKELGLPVTSVSARDYSVAGYVGADVNDIALDVLSVARSQCHAAGEQEVLSLAQASLLFIDEVDKISGTIQGTDVGFRGTQASMLRLLEGGMLRTSAPLLRTELRTEHLMFVLAGAFEGIEEIVTLRNVGQPSAGFGTSDAEKKGHELLVDVCQDDLVEFGLMPEFAGRITNIATTRRLSREQLVAVLTRAEGGALDSHRRFLAALGIELTVTDCALHAIADLASKMGTGARALEPLLARLLAPLRWAAPQLALRGVRQAVVDRRVVAGEALPDLRILESRLRAECADLLRSLGAVPVDERCLRQCELPFGESRSTAT